MTQITDLFLGLAIGDAFGVGLESQDRDWLVENTNFGEYQSLRSGKYVEGYRLGDYSDDTADTLAIAKLLTENRDFTIDSLYQALKEEWDASKIGRGGLPRAGYGSIKRVFIEELSLNELQAWQAERHYPGNAPTMRSIPLGFLSIPKMVKACQTNANVTHPHQKTIASSLIIAFTTRLFLTQNYNPKALIDKCLEFLNVSCPEVETTIYLNDINMLSWPMSDLAHVHLAGPQPIRSFTENKLIKGLNSDAMRTAGCVLYILKHVSSAMEALKASIHIGGDVDSLAALTVGLAGARYGLQDIPEKLLNGVENREYILQIAKNFENWIKNREDL